MKKSIASILSALGIAGCSSQPKEAISYTNGDIKIKIETGSEWKHPFNLFMGIKKKNTPQIAIWAEDMEGNYLTTIYVSNRTATQSWMMSGGDRRKSALPYWAHRRGVQYEDGLYMPTKKNPLPDAVTGATPSGNFDVRLVPTTEIRKFVVKAEFNHSTDFNEFYPASAEEGDTNYSGGKGGSGQPAIVYEAIIDLDSDQKEYKAQLIGHSSTDGSNGELYTDISTLTTALNIVKEITIRVQE
jgi:hypothetical protein